MSKEEYQSLDIEIVRFDSEDIITGSPFCDESPIT